MKREYILRKLRAAGLLFKEGSNHTKILNKHGKIISVVPRHKEVKESTAKEIENQTGVKLF